MDIPLLKLNSLLLHLVTEVHGAKLSPLQRYTQSIQQVEFVVLGTEKYKDCGASFLP